MASTGVRTREGTTSFTIAQTLDSERFLGAQQVSVQLNFMVEGSRRDASRMQRDLQNEFSRCTSVGLIQRFIDEHREMINYVNVNRQRRLDVGTALYSLEDYLEPGARRGLYTAPAQPVQAQEQPRQAAPATYAPRGIEAHEVESRSPLEYMNREAERAQMPPEQRSPPPQLQVQEDVLLTAEEAAAVETVPEPVRERAAEQVRRNVSAINSSIPADPEQYQREYFAPEISADGTRTYSRVGSPYLMALGWWNELNESCERSEALAARLEEATARYYEAVDALEAARGTPQERTLRGRVRELERQMRGLEREMDPLLARQGQLIVNILATMPDAYAWTANEPSRDRQGMVSDLNAIRDGWASIQEKIRKALSLRELTGDVSPELASAFAALRRGSIENMSDVFARMMQNDPEVARSFVDWAALGRAAQAGPVVAPITAAREEALSGAFTFRSRRGTFRITIAGEDLSGLTFNEVKKRMMELVNDQSISNRQLLEMLTVEQLREGREPYRYMSRYLLRTEFFQNYASGAIRTLTPSLGVAGSVPVVERPAAVPREEERRAEEALRREGLAPAPVPEAVEIPSEYSASYDTVMGWNRRLSQLESENARLMERAVASRDTGIEEDVERRFDANVEEQARLMANISRSLEDAISAVRSGANKRRLEGIRDGWPEVQRRLLDLIDVRGSLRTEYPTYREPMRSRILYLCNTPIGEIRAYLAGQAPAPAVAEAERPAPVERPPVAPPSPAEREAPAAPPAPVERAPEERPVAPAPAAVERPAPVSAEGVRDAAWARDMHDSIIRRSLSLRDFARERDAARAEGAEYARQEEMDRFLAELVRDYVTFRNEIPRIRADLEAEVGRTGLGLQVLDEMKRIEARTGSDGRRIAEITGMSARELVAFAETYLAGVSAAPPAPVEREAPPAPMVAEAERPAAAERPPVAPPAPVERLPAEARPVGREPAVPAAPVEEAPVEAAPAEAAPVAEAMPAYVWEAASISRAFGIDRADASNLADFLNRDEGRVYLNIGISAGATPAQREAAENRARRIFSLVSIEAARRGIAAYTNIEETDSGYRIIYKPLTQLEQLDSAAIEAGNPFATLNFGATYPLTNERNGSYGLDVFAEVLPAFNERMPIPVVFTGYGDSYEVAADPESQLIAYAYDSARRLIHWRFTSRENGLDVASGLIYPGGRGYGIATNRDGAPMLSLEENAAWAAAFWTADAGRVMVTLGGEENVEGIDVNLLRANIESARRGRDNGEDPKYRAHAASRLREFYENPDLLEDAAGSLSPELRISLELAAEYRGRLMFQERVRRTGMPENAEDVLAACVNAARMQLVAKIEAETGGRGAGQVVSAGFTTFTHGGREYYVGTNLVVRSDLEGLRLSGFEDAGLDGKRYSRLLFVPSNTPGEVVVVGALIDRGNGWEAAMLRDGQAVPYTLDWRDSIGFTGVTRRWSYHLPMFDIGGVEFALDTPNFKAVEPPALRPGVITAPPEEKWLRGQYGIIPWRYGAGAEIGAAVWYMENLRIGDEPVTIRRAFSEPAIWIEYANFRRAGGGRYYATATPLATSANAERFEEAGEIQNVAEFAPDGNVYVYMRGMRIVDADRQSGEEGVRRVLVGTYSFTLDEAGEKVASADIRVRPEYSSLILTRIDERELDALAAEGRARVSDNRLELELATQARIQSGERNLPYVYLHAGPVKPEVEGGSIAEVELQSYEYGEYMIPRWRRVQEIDARFLQIRELRGTYITFEEWDAIKAEADSLHAERERICNELLEHTQNALNDADARGIQLEPAARTALENQVRALRVNLEDISSKWAEWVAARDEFDASLAPYR